MENQALAEIQKGNPNEVGKYMFFNQTFRECGYKSYKNNTAIDALVGNNIDSYCTNNWDYFCDYGTSQYKDSNIMEGSITKKRNNSKTMFLVNQVFNGGFD
jgi:hypothetical protein